ncbi:MAG: hypothetical protein JNL12_11700 [Planctomycetes bacterium]|nr:hypothetical protein [Planctomycetota bacterium]
MPVRSAPKSNPLPLILGGLALLVVVVVLVVMSQSGGKGGTTPAANKPAAANGKQPHVPAATSVPTGTAKAGKTPTTPPPPLAQETLQKAASLLDEAKTLFNDGVRLRTAGDNAGARSKQSIAKDKIDEVKSLLAAPLRWQEEADLEGWAMPAEYTALGKFYGEVSSLEKKVRMSGGT